jgi:hypothetical protein
VSLALLASSLTACSASPTCQELRTCESPRKDGEADSRTVDETDASQDGAVTASDVNTEGSSDSAIDSEAPASGNSDAGDVTVADSGFGDAHAFDVVDSRAIGMFGSVCASDEDCKGGGASFFCMKTFDVLRIPDGLCTRPCEGASKTDCSDMMGTCLTERSGTNDASPTPRSACFPTCKLDVPCRSGFKCQFVYVNGMLVEPSVCVPSAPDAGDASGDQ